MSQTFAPNATTVSYHAKCGSIQTNSGSKERLWVTSKVTLAFIGAGDDDEYDEGNN